MLFLLECVVNMVKIISATDSFTCFLSFFLADSTMNCVVLKLERENAFTDKANFSALGVACDSLQKTRVICERKRGNLYDSF